MKKSRYTEVVYGEGLLSHNAFDPVPPFPHASSACPLDAPRAAPLIRFDHGVGLHTIRCRIFAGSKFAPALRCGL